MVEIDIFWVPDSGNIYSRFCSALSIFFQLICHFGKAILKPQPNAYFSIAPSWTHVWINVHRVSLHEWIYSFNISSKKKDLSLYL